MESKELQNEAIQYFEGFLFNMEFFSDTNGLFVKGWRLGNEVSFIMPYNISELRYHWLENIKGDIIRLEVNILKQKSR